MARQPTGQVIEPDGQRQRSWAIRFRAYGERRYLTLGTAEEGWSRRRAEEELANVLADVRRGIWQPPRLDPEPTTPEPEPTFHEFASRWFADHEAGWRPNTRADYRWVLELHLLPWFKDKLLSEITAEEIDRYANAKRREGRLSNNSINKTLTRLSQILGLALDYEKISRNPARGKKRRLPAERRARSWVEPEQLPLLLDSCGAELRPLVATLAGAGLRIGEAIALAWADVNLATGTLTVSDSKTQAGVRTVDLPDGLAAELRVHKARSRRTGPGDPVFRNQARRPQNVRNAQARLKPAIRKANRRLARLGIEPISEKVTPHSLRRTYASLRAALRDDPVYVAEQLGHTDPAFTFRVYQKAAKRRERLSGAYLREFDRALQWAGMGREADSANGWGAAIGLPEPLAR